MIYIVEDDIEIRDMEIYALQSSGFTVKTFDCGKSLDEELRKSPPPSVIILDIMLPGEDGLTILKRLRSQEYTKNIPVMMLTAKDSELDKVKGLDLGADDYMTKPFGILEFISRIKALIRRSTSKDNSESTLQIGNILLDASRHIVTVDKNLCELTFKEFELLKMLMTSPGRVFSRQEILEKVWGIQGASESQVETRTVDVHIKTLRQKLGAAGTIIQTIRNVGYKVDS